jgi:hypothetical protein
MGAVMAFEQFDDMFISEIPETVGGDGRTTGNLPSIREYFDIPKDKIIIARVLCIGASQNGYKEHLLEKANKDKIAKGYPPSPINAKTVGLTFDFAVLGYYEDPDDLMSYREIYDGANVPTEYNIFVRYDIPPLPEILTEKMGFKYLTGGVPNKSFLNINGEPQPVVINVLPDNKETRYKKKELSSYIQSEIATINADMWKRLQDEETNRKQRWQDLLAKWQKMTPEEARNFLYAIVSYNLCLWKCDRETQAITYEIPEHGLMFETGLEFREGEAKIIKVDEEEKTYIPVYTSLKPYGWFDYDKKRCSPLYAKPIPDDYRFTPETLQLAGKLLKERQSTYSKA